MKFKIANKHTSRFIINCGLLLLAFSSFAQENNPTELKTPAPLTNAAEESPHYYPQRYGLRVGVDLFRITRSFYDNTYQGFEVVGDYRLTKNWYAAAEIGHDKMDRDESSYGFTTNGNYIRIGGNYNLYENWLDREDMIYVGFRYGFATFSQTLNWYQSYTTDPYFPKERIEVDRKQSGLSAHWVEFVAGIKTRVFSNVFMGFTMRLNGLISQTQPDDFENLYIPGYNKKHSGSIGVGFNYTISYLFPLYKSKKDKFVVPTEEEAKFDLEGNAIEQAEDLKMIENNKKKKK
ncbi:hypothetical protein HX049_13355 [Myroides odoratimimus]|uniref:DUF6048 family protein n=1 Tax=Myroides odoratimimus TaxID=76832 RepID=UPI00257904CB|nr:DUF6048 family protein [Myroides odoratimimus]MDM1398156.1 hypothetical protein [Myroides odoratimimus]